MLALVLVVGYCAAWLFARRIRRLERAAERIASGRFDEPIVDRGQDEIGELARAFERMRLRLAQLDRARREFIANASHELRTPLFSLGGFLELLGRRGARPGDARRSSWRRCASRCTRLTKLATELLDLSRLDAGQIDLEREPVSLAGHSEARRRRVRRRRRGRPSTRSQVDDGRGHASRSATSSASSRSSATWSRTRSSTRRRARSVAAARGARAGPAWRSRSRTTGPASRPSSSAHVFERFYRGDGSQASGSGLGLAIALELARVMGGTLELEQHAGPDGVPADAAVGRPPRRGATDASRSSRRA